MDQFSSRRRTRGSPGQDPGPCGSTEEEEDAGSDRNESTLTSDL